MTEAQKLARFEELAQHDARELVRKLALKAVILEALHDSVCFGEHADDRLADAALTAYNKITERLENLEGDLRVRGEEARDEYGFDGVRLVTALEAL